MNNLANVNLEILREIKKAGIPVGAAFLSEKIVMPQSTIGRVLASLEADGLLEKISNKGRRLTAAGEAFLEEEGRRLQQLNDSQQLYYMSEHISKDGLVEILEVRKLLECKTAELACIESSDEEIAQLEEIMLGYVYEMNHGGLADFQDLEFHLKIAELSKNHFLYQILKMLLSEKHAYTKFALVVRSEGINFLYQHEDIMQAIKNRNAKQAHLSMEHHLNHLLGKIRQEHK